MTMQNVDRVHRRESAISSPELDFESLRAVAAMSFIGLTISLFIVSLLMH
jgi:hypothetical protein